MFHMAKTSLRNGLCDGFLQNVGTRSGRRIVCAKLNFEFIKFVARRCGWKWCAGTWGMRISQQPESILRELYFVRCVINRAIILRCMRWSEMNDTHRNHEMVFGQPVFV